MAPGGIFQWDAKKKLVSDKVFFLQVNGHGCLVIEGCLGLVASGSLGFSGCFPLEVGLFVCMPTTSCVSVS